MRGGRAGQGAQALRINTVFMTGGVEQAGGLNVLVRNQVGQLIHETGGVGSEHETFPAPRPGPANGLHFRDGNGKTELFVAALDSAAGPAPFRTAAANIWMKNMCIVHNSWEKGDWKGAGPLKSGKI